MCGAYAISQNAAAAAEMLNFGNEPLAASVDAFVLGSVVAEVVEEDSGAENEIVTGFRVLVGGLVLQYF